MIYKSIIFDFSPEWISGCTLCDHPKASSSFFLLFFFLSHSTFFSTLPLQRIHCVCFQVFDRKSSSTYTLTPRAHARTPKDTVISLDSQTTKYLPIKTLSSQRNKDFKNNNQPFVRLPPIKFSAQRLYLHETEQISQGKFFNNPSQRFYYVPVRNSKGHSIRILITIRYTRQYLTKVFLPTFNLVSLPLFDCYKSKLLPVNSAKNISQIK